MPDEYVLAILRDGVAKFNEFRISNPDVSLYLVEADLSGFDLRFVHFAVADLRRLRATKCDFRGATLEGAHFNESDLAGSDLRDVNLSRAQLDRANLTDVDAVGAVLDGLSLREEKFVGADLTNACMRSIVWFKCDFEGAVLRNAILEKADIRDSKLSRADFSHSKLGEASL